MYASFIDHPLGDERVIVTRTFSKVYGLAGMRLGYVVAAPEVIRQMQKFATEDNINAAVTQAATTALDDDKSVTTLSNSIATIARNFSIKRWHVPLSRSIPTRTL